MRAWVFLRTIEISRVHDEIVCVVVSYANRVSALIKKRNLLGAYMFGIMMPT